MLATNEEWELLDYLCNALPEQQMQVAAFVQALDPDQRKAAWHELQPDILHFQRWQQRIEQRVSRQLHTYKADWNPLLIQALAAKFGGDVLAVEWWIYASLPGIAEQVLSILFSEREPFKPKLQPLFYLKRIGYKGD